MASFGVSRISNGQANCFDCFRRCCNLIQLLTLAKHPPYMDLLHCNLPARGGRVKTEGVLAMTTISVQTAKTQATRRSRPLTATQERLFFGALFVIAAVVQVGVVWAQIVH